MKNVLFFLSMVFIASWIAILGCKKSNNSASPSTPLGQLFTGIASTPQNFTVIAGRDTVIYGTDSTMLHFYANSFKDATGNTITNKFINIQLTEMYKPGEMIRNRATTITTDGNMLQSGGEINIVATMNGQEVFANKYGVGFKQSSMSSVTMSLYYSNGSSDSAISWTIGNTNGDKGTVAYGTIRDTTHFIDHNSCFFVFDSCTHFNYTNCDNGVFPLPRISYIRFTLPDNSFNIGNTEMFLNLTTASMVLRIDFSKDSLGYLYNFAENPPLGYNYELIAISNKNGGYYYFEQSGVTTDQMTINVALAPETRGDIISRLSGLR